MEHLTDDNPTVVVSDYMEDNTSPSSENADPDTITTTIPTSLTPSSERDEEEESDTSPDQEKSLSLDNNGHIVTSSEGGVKPRTQTHDLPEAPDGGWGWVVVFASFLVHVIADGVVYSFGVFLMEFVDVFDASRADASWIGALQPAVTFTVGPVASALTARFGCRAVTICGAVIAGFGFCISVFAQSLVFLYFTCGIMAGVGFGMIYVPAIVSVSMYFEKKRAFATGLAVCGSGVGTFVMAPLTEMLVREYRWQGAVLILGGIIFNVTICGILFRPLKRAPAVSTKDVSLGEGKTLLSSEGITVTEMEALPEWKENSEVTFLIRKPHKNVLIQGEGKEKPQTHVDFKNEVDEGVLSFSASQSLVVPVHNNGQNPAALARSDGALHRRFVSISSNGEGHGERKPDSPTVGHNRKRLGSHSSTSSNANTLSPLRKDAFYSGSLYNIPMYKSQPDMYLATITPVSPDEGDGVDGAEENKRSQVREMMSFALLKNPVFLTFGISNFFTSIGFNMPFIFLPDRAKLASIDEKDAAFLLSVIGIANTAGRVIFGFLSDRPWINRLYLYNSALTFCGLATALSVAVGDSYAMFVVYAIIFGLLIGVYVTLTSVVLVDLLGLDHLTNAFGLLLLFQGAATFIGPPLAGSLYDWTGSYDISFILMGSLIALSGAMLFLLPCIQRRYNRQETVASILREVDMGKQVHGDPDITEIIHSRELLSSAESREVLNDLFRSGHVSQP